MAFLPNPDGTYTATDPDGNVIAEQLPAEYVPPEVIEQLGAAASPVAGIGNVANAVTTPPPAPSLYNAPTFQAPPSDLAFATADKGGAGDFAEAARQQRLKDREASDAAARNAEAAQLHQATRPPGSVNPAILSGTPPAVAPTAPAPVAAPPSKYRYDPATDRFIPNTPAAQVGAATATAGAEAAGAGPGDPMLPLVRKAGAEMLTGKNVYVAPRAAGWQPQHETVERQTATSPETKLGIALAYQNAIDTARSNAAGVSAVLTEQALSYEKQRDEAQARIDDIKKREAERDATLRPKIQMLDKQAEQIRSFRVDPDAYWEKKGVVGGILANIGIALGALGSAVTGGPNQVYQRVRAEIEDEINAQQTTFNALRASQEGNVSALAQMRQLFISPEAAESATRSLMNEAMASETRRMAAEFGSAEATANGESLAAKLTLDAANERAKAEQLEGGAIRETLKYQPAVRGGVVHLGPKNATEALQAMGKLGKLVDRPIEDVVRIVAGSSSQYPLSDTQQKLQQQALNLQLDANERAVRDPITGETYYAANKELGNKYQGFLTALAQLKANNQEIATLYKKNSVGVKWFGEDRARVETLVAANTFLAQEAIVGNALQAHEEKRVAPLTGEKALDFANRISEEAAFNQADKLLDLRIKAIRSNLQKSWVPGVAGYAGEPPKGASNYNVPKGAVKVEEPKKE